MLTTFCVAWPARTPTIGCGSENNEYSFFFLQYFSSLVHSLFSLEFGRASRYLSLMLQFAQSRRTEFDAVDPLYSAHAIS